jgi:hypothetical protein
LVAVLLLGIFLALVTLILEKMYVVIKAILAKRMGWVIDKVEEEGNSQSEQRKNYAEE